MFEDVDFDFIAQAIHQGRELQQQTLQKVRSLNRPLVLPSKAGWCVCAFIWNGEQKIKSGLLEYRLGDGFYAGTIKVEKGVTVEYFEILEYNGTI